MRTEQRLRQLEQAAGLGPEIHVYVGGNIIERGKPPTPERLAMVMHPTANGYRHELHHGTDGRGPCATAPCKRCRAGE